MKRIRTFGELYALSPGAIVCLEVGKYSTRQQGAVGFAMVGTKKGCAGKHVDTPFQNAGTICPTTLKNKEEGHALSCKFTLKEKDGLYNMESERIFAVSKKSFERDSDPKNRLGKYTYYVLEQDDLMMIWIMLTSGRRWAKYRSEKTRRIIEVLLSIMSLRNPMA